MVANYNMMYRFTTISYNYGATLLALLHYNITWCFQGFYHVNAYGDVGVGVPCTTALKNAGMKESFLPQTCENFCLCRYR